MKQYEQQRNSHMCFSCYKGTNTDFALTDEDASIFFNETRFALELNMDKESLELFRETFDQKIRIFGKQRFPENKNNLCYLSMSERVINTRGETFRCSHLFRDGIMMTDAKKHEKCVSGCNRRLVKFNEDAERKLNA